MPKRMIRPIRQDGSVLPEFWYHKGIDRAVASSIDYPLPVQFGLSASVDPFARQRVSQPYTLFDSKLLWNKSPMFWDEEITNNSGLATSIHSTDHARVQMSVGSNDEIVRQTFQRFNYQPGKGQRIEMTFNLNGGQANVRKTVGMFNDDNGIFLMIDGNNLYFVIRKGGVDTEIPQRNWNQDTFDGNGISKINFNTSKTIIMIIDFEWLGVGLVRCGFIVGGEIHYCHYFLHSNIEESVYISTPNITLRYAIIAADTGEGGILGTFDHICSSVTSEGGIDPNGKTFGADTGDVVQLSTANTEYGVLAIRLRTTHLDLITEIINYSTYSTSNGAHYASLWLNPTITGSWTFNDYDTTYSGVQIADGGNGITITGGIRMHIAPVEGSTSEIIAPRNRRWLGAAIDDTRDIIAIGIRPLTQNQNCLASLNWREQ